MGLDINKMGCFGKLDMFIKMIDVEVYLVVFIKRRNIIILVVNSNWRI